MYLYGMTASGQMSELQVQQFVLWAKQVVGYSYGNHMRLPSVAPGFPPGDAGDSGSIPESGRSPKKDMAFSPIFLPEKSHGQRSLACYSLVGRRVRPN